MQKYTNRISKYLDTDTPALSVKFKSVNVATKEGKDIVLNSGGWRTPTARAKISEAIAPLGFSLAQRGGVWFINKGSEASYVFADGMRISRSGKVTGAKVDPIRVIDYGKLIKQYVSHFVREWKKGRIPPPNPSDPHNFYQLACERPCCSDAVELRQHLSLYMQRGFCFGSLLMAAVLQVGGTGTEKLSLIDKLHIEQWLKKGKPRKSKLLDMTGPPIGCILLRYLRRLYDVN